jgi:hypothetical protein
MCDSDRQHRIHARLAFNRQTIRGGTFADHLERLAACHDLRRPWTHHRDRIGKGRDSADMIPVGVRRENVRHSSTEFGSAAGDPRHFVSRDAGVDHDRLALGDEQERARLPERAFEALEMH